MHFLAGCTGGVDGGLYNKAMLLQGFMDEIKPW